MQALDLAVITGSMARGDSEIVPGEMVEKFDDWLYSEPEVIDREKAQLFAALGVGPS